MNRVPAFDYRVIEQYLTSLDCPRALTILILMKYGEFEQIVNMSFSPFHYNTLESARDSLAATELLRKHEDLPTGLNPKATAMDSFFRAELVCKETNIRLRERNAHAPSLYRMSRKIADVLGSFDFEEFVSSSGWGPGSTVFIKKREATIATKFERKLELTPGLCTIYDKCVAPEFVHWKPTKVVIEGNRVITVPKNAKTDRIIAVEPSLNLYLQKGVGTMIRRRLKRFGVDLNSQEINQSLAREGSATNDLATIDFSAASDTISYQLICELLPFEWFSILERLRSPRGFIKDGDLLHTYEKFSSMGNGFTFELESLIFWAAAKAVVPVDHPYYSKVSVYGDDIIIPSDCVDEYTELCNHLGFTINATKSYSSSYYRESCGLHAWGGVDITPIYLRRYLDRLEKMRFHNRVVELSRRTIGHGFRDKRFRACINFLWASRAKELTCTVIPIGYGDLGYVKSFDEVSPVFNRRFQRGFYTRFCVEKRRTVERDDDSLRLSRLYHLMKQGDVSETSFGNTEFSARGGTKILRKKGWVPDWPSLGPWI